MNRKDCENFSRHGRFKATLPFCAFAMLFAAGSAGGAEFRLWPTAVVVADSITLGDLVELRGLTTSDEEEVLRGIVVTDAPPAGGSRIIHHAMIRSALRDHGVNLAKHTLAGAAQCEVRRPALAQPVSSDTATGSRPTAINEISAQTTRPQIPARTLRQAVQEFFDAELVRYRGRAEILFDRSDERLLELTGPPLQFVIRRDKGPAIGLIALEISVQSGGKVAQELRLVVRTALSRNVLTARRAINQGATVTAADVELLPVTFTKLDDLGIEEATMVIGQRARRFIPAGTRIAMDAFEPVPLVLRGQLITLVSEVGGVRVVTTAKACDNGIRGETIRVRSADDRKVEFDAIVTGPGEARAAGSLPALEDSKPRFAGGATP